MQSTSSHPIHAIGLLIGGVSKGIGFQTTQQLALAGARVYLSARNEPQALECLARIRSEAPGEVEVEFLKIDLSDMKSVKAAAEAFMVKETRLDILSAFLIP